MDKMSILLKLNSLELDILASAYTPDDDGSDEKGNPIIRQVYTGMDESDVRAILNKITEIIKEIKESE